jgi:hypothetical protein
MWFDGHTKNTYAVKNGMRLVKDEVSWYHGNIGSLAVMTNHFQRPEE